MSERPVSYYAVKHSIKHTVLNNAIRDHFKGKPWGLKAQKVPMTPVYIVAQADFEVWYQRYQQNRQKRKANKVIINLTPHTITVVDSDNQIIREYPSTGVARVATTATQVGSVDGISIVKTVFGEVQGLPDPDGDTTYMVSMVVAQAVSGREDIIAPDTGPTAYRIDGKIIGVRQFARY